MSPRSCGCGPVRPGNSLPGRRPAWTCWPAGWWPESSAPTIYPLAQTNWRMGWLPSTARGTSIRAFRWIRRGGQLAKEHSSAQGPPVSLLDQEVIQVSSAEGSVGVPMRCVFALTAMGFLPQSSEAVSADEIVRVRVLPAWLRIDARFGSVYRRRGDPVLVLR